MPLFADASFKYLKMRSSRHATLSCSHSLFVHTTRTGGHRELWPHPYGRLVRENGRRRRHSAQELPGDTHLARFPHAHIELPSARALSGPRAQVASPFNCTRWFDSLAADAPKSVVAAPIRLSIP